jgi:uncharacterized protein YjbJ (UPF0337 family)
MAEQQPRRGARNSTTPETFADQWQQLRAQIGSWWDRLTEADLEQIAGQKARLIGLVQERYGYAQGRAQQEVERRLQEYSVQMEASGLSRMGETVTSAAQEGASRLTETAGEVTATAQETAASAASAVTHRMKGAGAYLREKRLDEITGDLAGLIQRYPVSSLLIGIGIGFLLARSLGRGRSVQGP